MNCQTVLEQLDVVRVDSSDLDEPELVAAAAHLRECPNCSKQFARIQEFDRAVARTNSDIPVPVEAKTALLKKLNAEEPAAEESVPSAIAPSRTSRRLWLTSLASAAAVAVVGVAVHFSRAPVLIPLADLADIAAIDSPTLKRFDGQNFAPELPAEWDALVDPDSLVGLPASESDPEHIAARYNFELKRGRRRSPITGFLVVVPSSSLKDAPPGSLLDADGAAYTKTRGQPWAAWSDGGLTYIVVVRGNDDDLRTLARALMGTPA